MRVRVLLIAALLVLTAGCNAFGGEATPTLTPADVPSPPERSLTERTAPAPVIDPGSPIDAERLASRHVDVLQNTSYRWSEHRREYGGRDGESTVMASTGFTTVRNGSRYVNRFEFDGPGSNLAGRYFLIVDAFGNDTATYVRRQTSRSDGYQYQRTTNPRAVLTPHRTAARSIRTYLDENSTTVRSVANGPRYVVTGTFDDHVSYGPVENGTVHAIVHEDGYVRQLRANFTVVGDERRIPIEYEFNYRSIGTTTVTEPAWVETARDTAASGPSWTPTAAQPATAG